MHVTYVASIRWLALGSRQLRCPPTHAATCCTFSGSYANGKGPSSEQGVQSSLLPKTKGKRSDICHDKRTTVTRIHGYLLRVQTWHPRNATVMQPSTSSPAGDTVHQGFLPKLPQQLPVPPLLFPGRCSNTQLHESRQLQCTVANQSQVRIYLPREPARPHCVIQGPSRTAPIQRRSNSTGNVPHCSLLHSDRCHWYCVSLQDHWP